jgi:type I restriction enzyme S subunit
VSLTATYSSYKTSGEFWLGDIPREWTCEPLKYVAKLNVEKVPSDGSVRYVGMENVQSDNGHFNPTLEQSPEGLSLEFREQDVLFGKLRPYLAKSWLASFSGICSSEFLVLSAHKVSPRFLNYVTLSREFVGVVDASTYGAKMPRASWDFIGLLKVPVPGKELSAQIAAFLDYETARIDALIEKQQQLIALLGEKRQAVISHAVTKGLNPNAPMRDSGVEWLGEVPSHWEVRAISKCTTKITNGYVGPTRDILVEDGVPYIQATHIKNGVVKFDDAYFVRHEWSEARSKSILKEGDVLIVQTGAGTGDVGLVSENEEGFNCHALILLSSAEKSISGSYLALALQSEYGKAVLYAIRTGGMHPHLNCGQVKYVKVPVPPRSEQKAIVDCVKSSTRTFDALESKAQTAVERLQERRTALISAAVTGKIDVRGWKRPSSDIELEPVAEVA